MLPIYTCCRQEFTFTHVRLTDSCNFSTKYFDLFCRLFCVEPQHYRGFYKNRNRTQTRRR